MNYNSPRNHHVSPDTAIRENIIRNGGDVEAFDRERARTRKRMLEMEMVYYRARREREERWAARRARWSARWLKNFGWGA